MANQSISQLKSILSDNGFSWTESRAAVFKSLAGGKPLSMNEVISKVNTQADRVSVYRTIELFERLGIVRRINVGWKYKIELSDQFVAHHHHLSCLKCGQIIDIEDERHIDKFIKEVADKFGFEPKNHQFEIDGICRNCLKS
ncbi:MAG TPA: Fur family transcriptional regulator [Candidatus Saccharimonadales bacterium]|jgi:Fe2+ or Zn2+ uptake regulation protein